MTSAKQKLMIATTGDAAQCIDHGVNNNMMINSLNRLII